MRSLLLLFAMTTFTSFSTATAKPEKTETLVLGGGCFWCLEGAYEIVPGVVDVESGYAGGHVKHPTYEQVCGKHTGHAEVVKITYDPAQVSLERLFELFWVVHDPTTLNRQGADTGPQYRSIILYTNEAQKTAAEKAIAAAQPNFPNKIVTEVVPLKEYYVAEDYHQDYFRKNPTAGYCQAVVRKKVDKVKKAVAKP